MKNKRKRSSSDSESIIFAFLRRVFLTKSDKKDISFCSLNIVSRTYLKSIKQIIMIKIKFFTLLLLSTLLLFSCKDDDVTTDPGTETTLHAAFSEFDTDNFTIALDGDEVVIETNGLPNHTSPYWSNTTERSAVDPMGTTLTTEAAVVNHPLFVEPTATTYENMAPGNIDDFNGSYTLTVPASPTKATSTTATGLGAIGFAISGSMIYNDEEGPNVPLDDAAPSLDYTGAHTGPQSYHYHLETKAWSNDDESLIGIIADGFFLYGRKCNSTGSYPTDLDESGGHTSTTQHTDDAEYHYHIQNELYLNQYYILFPDDYQGTPSDIQ